MPIWYFRIMPGNSFGTIFRVTTFGESHGAAIGCVVDGCPAGLTLSADMIQADLDRRRPGQSAVTTSRQESDQVEILSGVFEGRTLGTPIALLIRNSDARSQDYDALRNVYRPSHADFTWTAKYGHRDHRGGGRSSARETAARVAAGAIAKALLAASGVAIYAYVRQVYDIALPADYRLADPATVESSVVRCPDPATAQRMEAAILQAGKDKDSLGGVVSCEVSGCPAGWGEPVFDKLQADLAKAMMSLPATRAFSYGEGFTAGAMRGSDHNDSFTSVEGRIVTDTNRSGGIQGGITNGMPLYMEVAFKPTATIGKEQATVTTTGESITLAAAGRHDPCVLPRAVPIVEAMAALVLADHMLRQRLAQL